jgi:CheY-like chemotaxis protein/anti-sigma regulatory factor (Ser/Thr protein kinase)
MVSRSALEQIVLNLVVNARDAMSEGGKLTLMVSNEGDDVQLSVSDTGVGIPTEVAKRVFEPFFTTKAKGTGLGLATIHRLLSQFGGTVSLESTVGVGTTFRVRFRKIEEPAQVSTPPRVTAEPCLDGRSKRILLAEDDPGVRKALGQMLVLDGYDVTTVADGDEALAMLPMMHRFGCVVTDISMRHVNGDELAEQLAIAYPNMPVLIMSGNREPRPATNGAPRLFLPKPFPDAELRRALREVTQTAHVS